MKNLIEQNGYCGCPELEKLYSLKRDAERTEEQLSGLSKTVDEDIRSGNGSRLLTLKDLSAVLERKIEHYQAKLAEEYKQRRVKFKLHLDDSVTDYDNSITPEKGVLTINCSSCNQQIDVVSND
jgi:hypothetical protein